MVPRIPLNAAPLAETIPGLPGGPELIIIAMVLALPALAGALAYRTGRAAGDDSAALWAIAIAALTLFGLIPGIVALFVYSYKSPPSEAAGAG